MKRSSIALIAVLISLVLSSCSAIEGIFKAGVWSGILLVVVIVAVVVFILAKVFNRK